LLAACGTTPTGEPAPGGVVTAVGTPFLVAFKIPICAATVALAAPISALAQIASPPPSDRNYYANYNVELRAGLEDSIRENCGPPYAVTP
jgi:hypothetical protein